ncbi:hypothetical protein [Kitasatospora sp. NPDC097643]|uniref:hypothetical protein n=1 Tax=Kitasatospora sp. NPDC097643 TaxID=3157230 RepID=UPI00331E10B7
MSLPLRIVRILGDRPFAEVGEPVLTVADEGRGLLAVAGAYEYGRTAPVGVYRTGDLACRAVLRARYRVHAIAFHPTAPLLAVGSGAYDGGYVFEGELLLLDLETGTTTPLFEHRYGRQVLGLTWVDEQELRVLMAPPDDGEDRAAWVEGYEAVVRRPDWRAVPPRSLTPRDLVGPRVPTPRPDGREDARRTVSALSTAWDPRRNVRAVEELPDGTVLATLDADEPEAPDRPECPPLADGIRLTHRTPPTSDRGPYERLRVRHGSRPYFREAAKIRGKHWLVAAPEGAKPRRLFPHSWAPGEVHFAGPGAETADGSLVHAGTVYNGHGLQPGGSFVVRREMTDGSPRWVFRTDPVATDLDTDPDTGTAYIAYQDGEIVALDLHGGTPRWRGPLTVAGIPAVPTALTVPAPGRLLIGTSDGRILDCATP